MPTALRAATCPLCKDTFDDAMLYSAHLAGAHGLIDDVGTETVLPEVEEEPEPEPIVAATALAVEPKPVTELERVVVVSTPEPLPAPAPVPTRSVMAAPAWLVLVIVVQLLVGVAGAATVGDDNDADSSSVQTAAGGERDDAASGAGDTPAPTAAPSTVNPLLDQQLADQALVRVGDLPRGWVSDDESVESDPVEDEAALEAAGQTECWDAANAPIADEEGAMAGSAFGNGLSGLFNEVQVFSSVEAAQRGVQAARNLTPCIAELFEFGVRQAGGDMTVGELRPLGYPIFGDESVAVSLQGTVIAPDGRLPVRIDGLIVRKDRTVSWVTALVIGDTLSSADEKFLMEKLATRMAGEAA